MSHHELHHIVNLEGVFEAARRVVDAGGVFVTSDMIGRNGHMRWPETLEVVEALWAFLPDRVKFNRQLDELQPAFVNWDCAIDGFEGVRAQDILPLLVRGFPFESFLAFGGIIEVFTDRAFGHNLDAASDKDRALIDFVSRLNDWLIDGGQIKPTQMFAVMRSGQATRCWRHWSPDFCLRSC